MMLRGIWFNLVLCFFNLIPIPPLDGSHLLYHMLPAAWGVRLRAIGNYGFLPLLLLLVLFRPVINVLMTPAMLGFWGFYGVLQSFGLGDIWDFTRG
jgi:Zn-dependent protease